jgi:hypothetical protein
MHGTREESEEGDREEANLAILRPILLLSLTGTSMKKSCVPSTLRHREEEEDELRGLGYD